MLFTTPAEVLAHLHSQGLFHMDLTLARMRDAVLSLGLARLPFVSVQLVGTNGKGSTAAFLAALAQAHGLRVGLFTSPHLCCPSERIRINGRAVPLDCWPALANRILAARPDLTYFELCTALALLAFAEHNVDIAVLEAGLGGRFDATSVIDTDMLCVTPIALDHEVVLGASLHAIAADKAGAVRSPAPVVMAEQVPEVTTIFVESALAYTAPLFESVHTVLPDTWSLSLAGVHQRDNARLALTAWRILATRHGWSCSPKKEEYALARAFMPGRLQTVPGGTLLDGAHNAHGMAALVASIQASRIVPSAIIFTCMADKNWDSLLPHVRHLQRVSANAPIIVPHIHNPRAPQAETLAHLLNAQTAPSLADALVLATQYAQETRPVLICGSLYLLGDFFTLFPQYLDPPNIEDPGDAP